MELRHFDFSKIPVHHSKVLGSETTRAAGPLRVSDPSDESERMADSVTERLFPFASASRHLREIAPMAGAAAGLGPYDSGGAPTSGPACTQSTKLPLGIADKSSPLPVDTRTEMEGAFGADFSAVRVHTNSSAGALSRSLKAQAFTYGNDIFFDTGNYDPDSTSGKRLLAHELTHTVQQRDTIGMLARQGSGRTTLQCVNENLSSAGVASWLLAIVGTTCGLIFGIAGSPSGPGAAGTAAFGAALCIAGVIGASVGAVLGVISGCWSDPNFRSRGAYLASNETNEAEAPAAT